MATTAQKYLQDFQNTINTNSAALKGIKEGYDTMYKNYASGLVNDGTFQAIENARKNSQDTTNRQYNDAARNYYSQYMQNQKALPERLSNLGVTGGATESALLKLMNQYSGNLYQNQSARANALNNINMQYDQQIANNSKTIAQQLAETYLRLAQQARDEVLAEQEAARQAALAAARSYGGGSSGGGGGYYYGDDENYYDSSGNSYSSSQLASTIAKAAGVSVDVAKKALANTSFKKYPVTGAAKSAYNSSKGMQTYTSTYIPKTTGTSVANGKRTAIGGGKTVSNAPKTTTTTKRVESKTTGKKVTKMYK